MAVFTEVLNDMIDIKEMEEVDQQAWILWASAPLGTFGLHASHSSHACTWTDAALAVPQQINLAHHLTGFFSTLHYLIIAHSSGSPCFQRFLSPLCRMCDYHVSNI